MTDQDDSDLIATVRDVAKILENEGYPASASYVKEAADALESAERELASLRERDIFNDYFTPRGPHKSWTGEEADALVRGWDRAQEKGRGLRESLFAAVNDWLRHHAQGINARSGQTAQQTRSEGREPDGEADAPRPSCCASLREQTIEESARVTDKIEETADTAYRDAAHGSLREAYHEGRSHAACEIASSIRSLRGER